MSYYRGAGDYYRGAGDGIGKGLLRLGKAATGLVRSKLARALPVVGTVATVASLVPTPRRGSGGIKVGQTRIHPTAALPGGVPLFERIKHRRINPTNPKALRRAIRRLDGFVQLSRRVLSQAGFTVSRTRRGPKTKRKARG